MKSIIFFPALLMASIYSFGQTLPPHEVKSKNDIIHKLVFNDEGKFNINPKDFHGFLFSGEGDIIDSTQYWIWNRANEKWELIERIFYTTDPYGNLIMQVTLIWIGIEWVNAFRDVSSYDAYNNELSDLYQTWNGTTWENVRLTTNVYDAENNRTSRTIQNWDGTMWVNANQLLFTYDDHHNILTRTSGTWLGTEWSHGVQSIYTYNDDHNLVLQEVQHWNGVAYETDQQVLYVYTPDGDLDTSLTQSWETDHWEDVSRNIFDYDANHNRTFYLNQMAVGDGTWIDVQRFTFTFDSDNIITGQLYEAFISGEWINQYRFIVENDTRQNRITEVFQVWEDEWINQDSFHFYYTLATGIGEVLTSDHLKLYPNPVTTTLIIDYLSPHLSNGTFTIFSQSGIKMMEGEMNDWSKSTIDVSKLMPGNYFILNRMGSRNSVHQFIKMQE